MDEMPNKIKVPTISLVAVGSELLNGETRETNLFWLIRFFVRRGGRINRAVVVPDDFGMIKEEVDYCRNGKIDLMVTTGGLGPTDDDATLAAIANALNCGIACDRRALAMVKARIKDMAKYRPGLPTGLTKERRSMADFPVGGEPIHNPVGVAPGMIYKTGCTTILSLPGVPSEMKGIMTISLKDFRKEFFKGIVYVRKNIRIRGIPEAELWPYVRRIQEKDPEVYIKTRLKVTGKIVERKEPFPPNKLPWLIILHFSVVSLSKKDGERRINKLAEMLMNEIHRKYKYPIDVEL